jgi:hypothetical protein
MIRGLFDTRHVFIAGKELLAKRSQKIRNHSPDGFNWGYGGSGPAQLALALLLHFSKNREFAQEHYQDFKWEVISRLPQADFEMEESTVTNWIAERRRQ